MPTPARRAQPVVDLLHEKGARCIGEYATRGEILTHWSVGGGRSLFLHEFGTTGFRDGYEVYIPISDTNLTDDTLTALAAYAEGK